MSLKNISVLLVLLLQIRITHAQPKASTIREYSKIFPTYPFSDPSPLPMASPVYPYFRFDGFAQKAVDKAWKVVELENDYISVMILPEIGGKIWAAIEKSTQKPFLYYNHAVKFRDIAMRGPWTSGGLEANYGIIGHTPNCATPVDYYTRQNKDGSVSCFIGTLDLLSRSYWCMEINLPKDKALFTTRSFWYNTTPLSQPYYHWMNAGLRAADDLEFIYPGNKFLGHNGEYGDWPVNHSNGKQISWYRNNDFGGYKSYHVFGKYSEFAGAYWHKDDFGMVRYGSHDDKSGKKIWIWGLSRQGMIWEKLLTDTDGQYVELQSGRLFNQNSEKSSLTPFTHRNFAAYGTDTWEEYWYPVMGTKGYVTANPYGALNIRREDGWLKIGFCPVQQIHDTLIIRSVGKIIYQKFIRAVPLKTFSDSIRLSTNADSLYAMLGDHLLVYESSPGDSLSRPVQLPSDFQWESAYGAYRKGSEAVDMKNFAEAEKEFTKALDKDRNYLPALTSQAELFYRNMRYADALDLATKALSISTEDGAANYVYGLTNEKLGHETDARDGFDIAAMDPAYRSAACTELCKIYLKRHEFTRALEYTTKALSTNQFNIEALQLQAVLYRYMQQKTNADAVLKTILDYDPLNHLARFEKYCWLQDKINLDGFLSNIRTEMPSEIILETAIWYYRIGLKEDALKVLSARPKGAEVQIWMDYLRGKAFTYTGIDPVRAFPFRSETAEMLEQLIAATPHWFLSYQLALIYRDKNNLNKCRQLMTAAGETSDFAPFYAFRASLYDTVDSSLVLHDLEHAIRIDSQWRYQKLLAEYYIRHHQYADALATTERFYSGHPDQYIMGMLYARTLLLNHRYEQCDKLLTQLNIIPFEGATIGHELYREAKLMQAVIQMKNKDYRRSIQFIDEAETWPENIGVGKPYATGEDIRLEEWMRYLCLLKQGFTNQADTALMRIATFTPYVDNTVPNYIPVNALISAWTFEKLGDTANARRALEMQGKTELEREQLDWMHKVYMIHGDQPLAADAEDANIRIIRSLLTE